MTLGIKELLPMDGRPVVAYSGLWSISSAFSCPKEQIVGEVLAELLDAVGNRTLLMPTYTDGYKEGYLNLDEEPGKTGKLNEALRKLPDTQRTASAFFSFAALGPDAGELARMRPHDAWSFGSVFDWIHRTNAHILMIGVPLKMCSFLHRVEWLSQVPYRYMKEFTGTIKLRGKEEVLKERLFVRSLDPLVKNVWPGIEEILGDKLTKKPAGRGALMHIDADALVSKLMPVILHNPCAFAEGWSRDN